MKSNNLLILTILSVIIILCGVMGCSTNSPEPLEPVVDTVLISPEQVTVEIVNQTWDIPENYCYYYYFATTDSIILSTHINVVEGSQIDILLLTAVNFNNFSNLRPFEFIFEGSGLKVDSKTYSISIPVGTYYIIIDNSSMVPNGATPSGNVSVHIKVSFTTYMYNDFPDISSIKTGLIKQ